MKVNKTEMTEKEKLEEKQKISSAFEQVKESGVKFFNKNYELYSITEAGCFLIGTYEGSYHRTFKDEDRTLNIFNVEKAVLMNKDGEQVSVEGKTIAIFSTSRLEYMLTHIYDEQQDKSVETDRKGHKISIIYTGIEHFKTKAGKKAKSHSFNFKDLTLMKE
jgi:hypothetical protein